MHPESEAALSNHAQNDTKDLLRFITCGSVDDGKSTLIGRMLYESSMIYEDQLYALKNESIKYGTTGEEMDLALLVDGLIAEREQGITIDVAYRFFATKKRKFIVADTPGHEQYTRNMATGASTADAAIVIVDARKGILSQTRRHSVIAHLLGIKSIILAINKMDLIDYDQHQFERIKTEYQQFIHFIGSPTLYAIPISARKGDNITALSSAMPWYKGPALLTCLETLPCEENNSPHAFRMPIQWVNRACSDFRGFTGRVTSGTVRVGDTLCILPGNQTTQVSQLIGSRGNLEEAIKGQSITITLKDEIDISRGNVLACPQNPCQVAEQLSCRLLWMGDSPMVSGRHYLFKGNAVSAIVSLGPLKHRVDVNTLAHFADTELRMNEIGDCDLFLDRAIAFEPYEKDRQLGAFILIDKQSYNTVAAGFIQSELQNTNNLIAFPGLVDQAQRVAIKNHKPAVLWFTGLSGAGKSTIANLVEQKLNGWGKHTILLDGDTIRQGLSRDLDFSVSGRAENIRRVTEVAQLMVEAGLITLVSFISPFTEEREAARKKIGSKQFIEIFVDVPLAVAETRDCKGLYRQARSGKIPNFTGISSPYEAPEKPDLHLDTTTMSPSDAVELIIALLRERKIIS